MSQTPIEWTDYVWNPTRGCSRVSEGCKLCYAERDAARKNCNPKLPGYKGFAQFIQIGGKPQPHWTGKVELIESKLLEPLHWKKPRRVFVNSMSDLFHENLPDESIDQVFAVMSLTPHITYQVLTKRAGRMREYLTAAPVQILPKQPRRLNYPLPNVWLGVSVENQTTADERIPELLNTPAAIRFVSYEPALAEVDFARFLDPLGGLDGFYRSQISKGMFNEDQVGSLKRPTLGWGIIGGESGPGARPFDIQWARNTIRQFRAAGVPLFVKQLGADPRSRICETWPSDTKWRSGVSLFGMVPLLKNSKGGDWDEWPEDLRVREFPHVHFAKRSTPLP